MKFWKMILAFLCAFLVLALASPMLVLAQGGSSVPAPIVSANSDDKTSATFNQSAITVTHGPDFDSTWMAFRAYLPDNPSNPSQGGDYLSEHFQGNVAPILNGTQFCLTFTLVSSAQTWDTSPSNPLGIYTNSSYGVPCGIWINSSYGQIPICLYNASSYTLKVGNVAYVNGLPTLTNNVTFNDIALETYGHGSSSINLVIDQEIIANWTTMKIKIGVYADLSNMHLYLPDGSEIPQGTKFSLNFQWGVDLSNQTASNLAGYPIGFPYIVKGNSLYFLVNGTTQSQLSVANMSLGDSYVEMQGSAQSSNRTADVQFVNSLITLGGSQGRGAVPSCNCFQSFTNLTYGLTTGVLSDPTITVNHAPVPPGWGTPEYFIYSMLSNIAPIVIAVAGVVVIVRVTLLFRKRKHSKEVP